MSVGAIIVAAGRGTRLGAELPKQLLRIGDRTMLRRSVDAFDRHPGIDVLVVVLDGSATITIDGAPEQLGAHEAVLVPRSAARSTFAGPEGARYLTIHGPRAAMSPRLRHPASPSPTIELEEPPS